MRCTINNSSNVSLLGLGKKKKTPTKEQIVKKAKKQSLKFKFRNALLYKALKTYA